jgi:hypothetical protein
MKRFIVYKLSVALAACLGITLAFSTAQAGQIGADLRQAMQAGSDVDFIVQFSDQVDLSSFPGQGKGKGMQRSALLWALKDQADASQSGAVELTPGWWRQQAHPALVDQRAGGHGEPGGGPATGGPARG